MDESGTYEEIEEYISIIDKFSIILDRLGKTIVLEEGQERVEQEGVSEEIVVKKVVKNNECKQRNNKGAKRT